MIVFAHLCFFLLTFAVSHAMMLLIYLPNHNRIPISKISFKMSDYENLLKLERQGLIRKLVTTQGRVTVPELSRKFGVSDATVRRDLDELMEQGWVRRTHGGAVNTERSEKEPPMLQRKTAYQAEKTKIGRAAAGLVQDGETIFLGSGTTVLEVAQALPFDIRLTVITNSLPVVNHFVDCSEIDLLVIGGMIRHSEHSMVGHIAEQAIREFRADRVIIGMRAIDTNQGLTNDFLPETMTDRAILKIAPTVIVVADHSKFGRVSSVFVAPITAANIIITDNYLPEEMAEVIRALGVDLMIVP